MSWFRPRYLLYALLTLSLGLALIFFLSGGIKGFSVRFIPFDLGTPIPLSEIASLLIVMGNMVAVFGEGRPRLIGFFVGLLFFIVFLVGGGWPVLGLENWLIFSLYLVLTLLGVIAVVKRY